MCCNSGLCLPEHIDLDLMKTQLQSKLALAFETNPPTQISGCEDVGITDMQLRLNLGSNHGRNNDGSSKTTRHVLEVSYPCFDLNSAD